ncbi:hypothetical protein SK128_008861, partial [Halocaridina rubra]
LRMTGCQDFVSAACPFSLSLSLLFPYNAHYAGINKADLPRLENGPDSRGLEINPPNIVRRE